MAPGMCDVTRGGLTMEDGSGGLCRKREKNAEQNVSENLSVMQGGVLRLAVKNDF